MHRLLRGRPANQRSGRCIKTQSHEPWSFVWKAEFLELYILTAQFFNKTMFECDVQIQFVLYILYIYMILFYILLVHNLWFVVSIHTRYNALVCEDPTDFWAFCNMDIRQRPMIVWFLYFTYVTYVSDFNCLWKQWLIDNSLRFMEELKICIFSGTLWLYSFWWLKSHVANLLDTCFRTVARYLMFVDWLCCQHPVDEPYIIWHIFSELQLPTLPQSDDEFFFVSHWTELVVMGWWSNWGKKKHLCTLWSKDCVHHRWWHWNSHFQLDHLDLNTQPEIYNMIYDMFMYVYNIVWIFAVLIEMCHTMNLLCDDWCKPSRLNSTVESFGDRRIWVVCHGLMRGRSFSNAQTFKYLIPTNIAYANFAGLVRGNKARCQLVSLGRGTQ